MEVSAKTGHNIKEFFRELAGVIAGGKKSKEDASSHKQTTNVVSQQVPASGGVDLSKANQGKEGRKKKC
jgi:hypothetical protein